MKKITKILIVSLALITLSVPAFAGRLGPHLERIIQEGKGNFAGKKFGRTMIRLDKGKQQTLVSVSTLSIPLHSPFKLLPTI